MKPEDLKPETLKEVTLSDIVAAEKQLRGFVLETPLKQSNYFSELFGKNIFFKMENLQHTGAFKVRGARNKLLSLTPEEKKRGVVTASAGNHAQGVAYQAKLLGVRATIVMPESAAMTKVLATRGYGAQVIIKGATYDDAYQEALELQKEKKMVFVHAYEDPSIIAGQGTIGLEILKQNPAVEVVIVPIGGGGLISGIATALKSLKPGMRVIGVQATGASAMAESLKKGKPVAISEIKTMAEGIAVKRTSPYTFKYIQKYVDRIVSVTDEEISAAILQLLEKTKTLVEGAGAVSLAALLFNRVDLKEKQIVCLLSGGNLDVTTLSHVIERGLVQEGRMVKLDITIDDKPGSLNHLTKVIADMKASIMQVTHDRAVVSLPFGTTKVFMTLETRGPEHVQEILKSLQSAGYHVSRVS